MLSVLPEARLLRDLAALCTILPRGVMGGISEIVSLTSLKVKVEYRYLPVASHYKKSIRCLGF